MENITVVQEQALHQFTPAEFARMWTVKMAIQAGFYTDQISLWDDLDSQNVTSGPSFSEDQ